MPAWPRAVQAESLAQVWMEEHAELERLGVRKWDLHGRTQRRGAGAASEVARLRAAQLGRAMFLQADATCRFVTDL